MIRQVVYTTKVVFIKIICRFDVLHLYGGQELDCNLHLCNEQKKMIFLNKNVRHFEKEKLTPDYGGCPERLSGALQEDLHHPASGADQTLESFAPSGLP